MALTPGGGRSPSTQPPPSPTSSGPQRSTQGGSRRPFWPRSASVSVLRLGLLIGGLVIIVDLLTQLMIQRTVNPDDIALYADTDEILNYVLFALLGVLVVRDTRIIFAGVVAGVFASLLDAIVVTAATVMVPPPTTLDVLEFGFAKNLLIGTVFAGVSGIVFALVQRWSGGQRPRQ